MMRTPRLSHAWFLAALLFPALAAAAFGQSKPSPAPPAAAGSPGGVAEVDRNGDKVIDYRVSYDRSGRVAREELDYDFDGTMDTFYYYTDGVLQREEIDTRNKGRIDIWVFLVGGDQVQRYERDTDGDGKPDVVRDFGKS